MWVNAIPVLLLEIQFYKNDHDKIYNVIWCSVLDAFICMKGC